MRPLPLTRRMSAHTHLLQVVKDQTALIDAVHDGRGVVVKVDVQGAVLRVTDGKVGFAGGLILGHVLVVRAVRARIELELGEAKAA